jgi:cyclophilin family peptidyl-prolyl cis-trans isomerase
MRRSLFFPVVLLAAGLGLVGCGTKDAKSSTGSETIAPETIAETVASESVAGNETPTEASTAEVAGDSAAATALPCPAADGSSPVTHEFPAYPAKCIDDTKSYEAVMETSKGTITFALDQKIAPLTVNSFVYLARYHYFEGILFHRVVPDFVLQAGDPKTLDPAKADQFGTGGPGYTINDEFPKEPGAYKIGSLVMAKTQEPNSSGSQFFIVSGTGGTQLPPSYSLFGQLVSGQETIDAIAKLGVTDGPPSEAVKIVKITINEK